MLCGLFHAIEIGIRFAVAQVVGQAVGEQKSLLRNHRDVFAQFTKWKMIDVNSVKEKLVFLNGNHATEGPGQCCFSAAHRTDNGD